MKGDRWCGGTRWLGWVTVVGLGLGWSGSGGCWQASANSARVQRMIASSLVKVYTTYNPPDYRSPWQRLGVETASGSGVIIDGYRILTAAHVVADHVVVEVRRAGATRRFPAEVEFVGHECDLALLTVAEPTFFRGATPLAFGELPRLRDRVDVYGFPEGGDRVSITAGIVSRIESGAYVHSKAELLLMQIDAAINDGNSGGPVMVGPRVVGIAAETLVDAENIGYVIPVPVIRHFLADVADGRFDGFPRLGIEVQPLQNEIHRRQLGLGSTEAGVLVTRINFGSSAHERLRRGDVLTKVNGMEVGPDETIRLRGEERVHFLHLITSLQIGAMVRLSIIRDGHPETIPVTLGGTVRLVPGPRYDVMPTYSIVGGLVFQPLSIDYLDIYYTWPENLANYALYQNVVTEARRQVVVLTQVLSHALNQGYDEMAGSVVATVGDVPPRDMEHFVELVAQPAGGWLRIGLEGGEAIVLDGEQARAAEAELLKSYDIPRARSVDLAP